MITKGSGYSVHKLLPRWAERPFFVGGRRCTQNHTLLWTAPSLSSYTATEPRVLDKPPCSFIFSLVKNQTKLIWLYTPQRPSRVPSIEAFNKQLWFDSQTLGLGMSSVVPRKPHQLTHVNGSKPSHLSGSLFPTYKKKGLDSVIAKVTSSSVNTMLLKNSLILKEENLGFSDKKSPGCICAWPPTTSWLSTLMNLGLFFS